MGFIKKERTELKMVNGKITAQPRMISPMDPIHRVKMARYFGCGNESIIVHYIDSLFRTPTVMKGLNLTEVASCCRMKWDKFSDPVFVPLDCSRFDAHCNRHAYSHVERILSMFVHPGERGMAIKLIKDMRKLKYCLFTQDGWFKQTAPHCLLPSGCTITSLFAIVLVCSVLYRFHIIYGWEFIDMGDDFGIFMERTDVDKLKEVESSFLGVGQEVVAEEPVDVFEQISFCQANPVFDGSKYKMVRSPFTCIKDCIKINTNITDDSWRKSVSIGGKILNSNIPFLFEFYDMIGRGASYTNKVSRIMTDGGMRFWLKGQDFKDIKDNTVSMESRLSFERAFGISPALQILFEEKCRATSF